MSNTKFYIAVGFARGESGGRDRSKPVVFGMGHSQGLARVEADGFDLHWDSAGGATLEVSSAIATKVRACADEVPCAQLGIHVKLDANGFIVGAEFGPDAPQ